MFSADPANWEEMDSQRQRRLGLRCMVGGRGSVDVVARQPGLKAFDKWRLYIIMGIIQGGQLVCNANNTYGHLWELPEYDPVMGRRWS
jgi:hypothetical protein